MLPGSVVISEEGQERQWRILSEGSEEDPNGSLCGAVARDAANRSRDLALSMTAYLPLCDNLLTRPSVEVGCLLCELLFFGG